MNIFINDEKMTVEEQSRLIDVAEAFGAKPPFALLVNDDFISASEHETKIVHEDDRIEIIAAIQGG